MKTPNPIIAAHDASGTSVLDVRCLPDDVKTEIIMSAFAFSALYGNGDLPVPAEPWKADAFDTLAKAMNRIDAHMHRLPSAVESVK